MLLNGANTNGIVNFVTKVDYCYTEAIKYAILWMVNIRLTCKTNIITLQYKSVIQLLILLWPIFKFVILASTQPFLEKN